MQYKHIHHCDTCMKSSGRVKPTPGEYKINVSFPCKTLHDHTDDHGCCKPGHQIPLEVKYAKTSERCMQLDFVGPKGQIRSSIHIEIPDYIAYPSEMQDELHHFEEEFARKVGLPCRHQLDDLHGKVVYDLARNMMDEDDPNRPDPSPIAGMDRDEAIAQIRATK